MTLAAGEQRALAKIEGGLRRSDPKLASMLSTFNRLTQAEEMPRREFLAAPGRLRWLFTSPGRYRRASRSATILPVVIAVCALGLMVVLFSAINHVRSSDATPGPATTCHYVMIAGCQSAVPANPKR